MYRTNPTPATGVTCTLRLGLDSSNFRVNRPASLPNRSIFSGFLPGGHDVVHEGYSNDGDAGDVIRLKPDLAAAAPGVFPCLNCM